MPDSTLTTRCNDRPQRSKLVGAPVLSLLLLNLIQCNTPPIYVIILTISESSLYTWYITKHCIELLTLLFFSYLSESVCSLGASFLEHLARFFRPTG